MKYFIIAAAILFGSFSQQCVATSQEDRDIADLFDRSLNVIEGRVKNIESKCAEEGCISKIVVAISSSYKGSALRGETIDFCAGAPISVGHDYVFFVEPATRVQQSGCKGVTERDGVFSRFQEKVYRYMSPSSFGLVLSEGKEYLTGWVLEKDFDRALIARDEIASPDHSRPSLDAVLGLALRTIMAGSESCAFDVGYLDDPYISDVLYARKFVVRDRKKKRNIYEYVLETDRRSIAMTVEMFPDATCKKILMEKNSRESPRKGPACFTG